MSSFLSLFYINGLHCSILMKRRERYLSVVVDKRTYNSIKDNVTPVYISWEAVVVAITL